MPIYEYRCTKCDHSFEAFMRPGDRGARCPNCHGSRLKREMSTFAARGSNGDAAAATAMMANSGAANGRGGCGGCSGGGCGCH